MAEWQPLFVSPSESGWVSIYSKPMESHDLKIHELCASAITSTLATSGITFSLWDEHARGDHSISWDVVAVGYFERGNLRTRHVMEVHQKGKRVREPGDLAYVAKELGRVKDADRVREILDFGPITSEEQAARRKARIQGLAQLGALPKNWEEIMMSLSYAGNEMVEALAECFGISKHRIELNFATLKSPQNRKLLGDTVKGFVLVESGEIAKTIARDRRLSRKQDDPEYESIRQHLLHPFGKRAVDLVWNHLQACRKSDVDQLYATWEDLVGEDDKFNSQPLVRFAVVARIKALLGKESEQNYRVLFDDPAFLRRYNHIIAAGEGTSADSVIHLLRREFPGLFSRAGFDQTQESTGPSS